MSLTQGGQYISSRFGIHNWDVEHNMAMFSKLSLAVCWGEKAKQRLVLWVTALINVQLVNSRSSGGQFCWQGQQVSTKMGSLRLFVYNWGHKNPSVIQSSRVSSVQELKWMKGQLGVWKLSVISWVSAVGFHCSLSKLWMQLLKLLWQEYAHNHDEVTGNQYLDT